MKKNILLLLLFLVTSALSFAQKAKKHRLAFDHLHYPNDTLPGWVKTYAVKAKSSSRYVLVGGQEERNLALKGFEKVDNFADADAQIKFEISGVKFEREIKSEAKTVKKDDREITVKEYYYTINARPFGKYSINLKDGIKVQSFSFGSDDYEYISKSAKYSSYDAARKQMTENGETLLEEVAKAAINKATKNIALHINQTYGYFYKSNIEFIITGKGKKFDYSDLNRLVDQFKVAIQLNNKKDVEAYKKNATECISGWEKALSEYDPKDKKAAKKGRINQKIADGICYNIAVAYMYMNEYDKALEYVNKGLVIDSSLIGKALRMQVKNRKKRFDKNEQRSNT